MIGFILLLSLLQSPIVLGQEGDESFDDIPIQQNCLEEDCTETNSLSSSKVFEEEEEDEVVVAKPSVEQPKAGTPSNP